MIIVFVDDVICVIFLCLVRALFADTFGPPISRQVDGSVTKSISKGMFSYPEEDQSRKNLLASFRVISQIIPLDDVAGLT